MKSADAMERGASSSPAPSTSARRPGGERSRTPARGQRDPRRSVGGCSGSLPWAAVPPNVPPSNTQQSSSGGGSGTSDSGSDSPSRRQQGRGW